MCFVVSIWNPSKDAHVTTNIRAAGAALHHHYALAGLALNPSGILEVAPQFHRSI